MKALCSTPKPATQSRPGSRTVGANRPVVEREIGHVTRRLWSGRKARCRARTRILTDILTRASAINLVRLATLGLHHGARDWAIA